MIAVPQARRHPDGGRQHHNRGGAQKDDCVRERGYRFPVSPTMPGPPSSHHDINLQQQCTQIGRLDRLGYTSVRAERRSRSARYNPERDSTGTYGNPGKRHQSRRSNQNRACPNQLKNGKRHKEKTRGYPILPMRGRDGKMNDRRSQRSDCRQTRCQFAVRPRRRCHACKDARAQPAECSTRPHLYPTETPSSLAHRTCGTSTAREPRLPKSGSRGVTSHPHARRRPTSPTGSDRLQEGRNPGMARNRLRPPTGANHVECAVICNAYRIVVRGRKPSLTQFVKPTITARHPLRRRPRDPQRPLAPPPGPNRPVTVTSRPPDMPVDPPCRLNPEQLCFQNYLVVFGRSQQPRRRS